ncbi:glycerol-3-phosphate dehydrogenase/oxidase [candidate division KSB1 bacterium]|nr:glycerol-3-phosphate dehydrogenase/oxidase [candidate division KSB1 bacterium]NIR72175.1 glycerol-3-phosphate dehydrogenase/oxidase [candidate division KSB1 bacterium]NIS26640.1 glycerol-3-phosphate dehydrogenase/oxidase [candidate division KSB1 bacterium]NIT73408.1 glycerol-3-phosphate dehydrogenase/oxidase [candidate division KSB1 bacterium]NIU27256.1 glycerol-3-phosphate dehydrogenase/oxidase [candidate division KSB1 bacterium]
MKRDLGLLGEKQFDVLVIGGGIYGVCAAWDAALRGLSVALIEKKDFGSATSSNSLKIIHGGLRYLQHADFKRMRESISERSTLMRIAPHLVHPLPCLMPTYGHAVKGREVMALALFINDLVGFDRNKGGDPQKSIPGGRIVSKSECRDLIPSVDEEGLTGAALWYDCQVYNAERMLISILHSAVEAGAVVANYVEMTRFTKSGERITGVQAKDAISGDTFEIRAQVIINNTGPWVNDILRRLNGRQVETNTKLSSAMNIVVRRQLFSKYAVGVWSKSNFADSDAIISKGSRLYFITPWRNYSVIGTTHGHYKGEANEFQISEDDVGTFLSELNQALPTLHLKREDICLVYSGMLPVDAREQTGDVKLLKQYQIIDHKVRDGLEGLLSVVGVKYTTARDVAQRTVDRAFEKMGKTPPRCRTSETPIYGGKIEKFQDFLGEQKRRSVNNLNGEQVERLVYNYGSEYSSVLKHAKEKMDLYQPVHETTPVLKAEVVHAARNEMAIKLADVVRRRTELGTAEFPGEEALESCASIMADELAWNRSKVQSEITDTKAIYNLV